MNTDSINVNDDNWLVKRPSIIVIVFAICFSFWLVDFWKPINVYNHQIVFNDYEVFQYYSYLPAYFINDGSFDWHGHVENPTPIGPLDTHVPKYNYGMAVLYFPFFTIANWQTHHLDIPARGFSFSFANCIHWGAIFYVILGLLFLRKFLLAYFNEQVTALTLFLCLFGNLLFYYTFSDNELPQSHLFFLFTAFLLATQKWHSKPGLLNSLVIGLILGLTSLIYVFELYIVVFFLFWNVKSRENLKAAFSFFKTHSRYLLLMLVVIVALWIPQLVFNLNRTGQLFFDAFPKEGYDFGDAQIYYVLFSYRRGWITYSPLILIALAGIFLKKESTPFSKGLFLITLLILLVVYSSWRGSDIIYFGARRLCPAIAWLSVPLALVIQRFFYPLKNNFRAVALKFLFVLVLFSCVCLNLLQTMQVAQHRVELYKMDEKMYWDYFKTFKFPGK